MGIIYGIMGRVIYDLRKQFHFLNKFISCNLSSSHLDCGIFKCIFNTRKIVISETVNAVAYR